MKKKFKLDSRYGSIDKVCAAGACSCDALIEECSNFGFLYSSSSCTGVDINGKNPDVSYGCCKWGTGECWLIESEQKEKECTNKMPESACTPNDGTCH